MRPPTLKDLIQDIDLQDILSINLERTVQVSVDIGAHIIADLDMPPPQAMVEVFDILSSKGIISSEAGNVLRKAVGFRNLSVRAYDQVEWARVFDIIHERLDDFRQFAQAIALHIQNTPQHRDLSSVGKL